jgi:L-amino acid N-acyltransferase YncA
MDAGAIELYIDRMQAVRNARPEDREAIASIYNEAIAERRSTFETVMVELLPEGASDTAQAAGRSARGATAPGTP